MPKKPSAADTRRALESLGREIREKYKGTPANSHKLREITVVEDAADFLKPWQLRRLAELIATN